ncbi:hypothetical protein D3C81_1677330 [compost metagenome]
MWPRMTRDRPEMFSQPMGLRLWGIAEEPFWPLAKGSSTSRNSLFWRPRISVANLSMEVAMSARVAMY